MLVEASPHEGDAARPAPTPATLDRVLRSDTRAGIYRALREHGEERTVREVAADFDVHPNVARTHLELLAEADLVSVGRRKHPGGGRPAKVYTAAADPRLASAPGRRATADPSLVVRLLASLLGVAAPTRPALLARAHESAAAEGRRLVAGVMRRTEAGVDLTAAAEAVTAVLVQLAPAARVHVTESGGVVVTGLRPLFADLVGVRPDLADAFEQGLLSGALAAAGCEAVLTSVFVEGQDPGWRLRPPVGGGSREAPVPAATADTRGMPREAAVVAALRAATGLRRGQVLEVLTEGPGAPAAFARWADRAGHSLLGVERVEMDARPVIRLLVRKGR